VTVGLVSWPHLVRKSDPVPVPGHSHRARVGRSPGGSRTAAALVPDPGEARTLAVRVEVGRRGSPGHWENQSPALGDSWAAGERGIQDRTRTLGTEEEGSDHIPDPA